MKYWRSILAELLALPDPDRRARFWLFVEKSQRAALLRRGLTARQVDEVFDRVRARCAGMPISVKSFLPPESVRPGDDEAAELQQFFDQKTFEMLQEIAGFFINVLISIEVEAVLANGK